MIKIYVYLLCIILLINIPQILSQDQIQFTGSSVYHPRSGVLISKFNLSNLPPRDSRTPDEVVLKTISMGKANFIRTFIGAKSSVDNTIVQGGDRLSPYKSTFRLLISRISPDQRQKTALTMVHYGGKSLDTLPEGATFFPDYQVYYSQKRSNFGHQFEISTTPLEDEFATMAEIKLGKFSRPSKDEDKRASFNFIIQVDPKVPLDDGRMLSISHDYGYKRLTGPFTDCTINQKPVTPTFSYDQGLLQLDISSYDFKANRTLTIGCSDGYIADGSYDFSLFRITYEVGAEQNKREYSALAVIREVPEKSLFVFVILIIIASILGLGALIVILCHKRLSCLNPDTEEVSY